MFLYFILSSGFPGPVGVEAAEEKTDHYLEHNRKMQNKSLVKRCTVLRNLLSILYLTSNSLFI